MLFGKKFTPANRGKTAVSVQEVKAEATGVYLQTGLLRTISWPGKNRVAFNFRKHPVATAYSGKRMICGALAHYRNSYAAIADRCPNHLLAQPGNTRLYEFTS